MHEHSGIHLDKPPHSNSGFSRSSGWGESGRMSAGKGILCKNGLDPERQANKKIKA